MARRCRCHSRCKHWTRGSRLMLPDERVVALEPYLATLFDAADLFDQDGLQIDPECGIHGVHPELNAECSCRGTKYSGVELMQWLELQVKAAGGTVFEPGHRPRQQSPDGYRPRNLAATG